MERDALGDRMKSIEDVNRTKLSKYQPTIMRIDGKAFSKYTKNFIKPFDPLLHRTFVAVCQHLLDNIQAATCVYTQSDEMSILMNYDLGENSQSWFDGNLQKIVSIGSSLATYKFNKLLPDSPSPALFDARAFILPKDEVKNYFIWRYYDATRNSIQGYGRSVLGHKACLNISNQNIMLVFFVDFQFQNRAFSRFFKKSFNINRCYPKTD